MAASSSPRGLLPQSKHANGWEHVMATATLGTYLRRLKQAMAAEALAPCSDRELVERFCSSRDDDAFRAIIERHGPMVFQVCRRVLAAPADVEDAFQATFLVLVRRGHTIRQQASLGSWLHGVARRTALKLRIQADRQRRREEQTAKSDRDPITDDTAWGELRSILDEELQRLPEINRAPLVLCHLEGRTQDEAAAQLDVSKRTLRRHLERGRELLGRRLARRGVTLGAALAAGLVLDCVQGAALPRALVVRTATSASHTAAHIAAPASVLSARVAAISDGVIKTMHYAKYKTVVAVLACGLVLGFGVQQFAPMQVSAQDKTSGSSPSARVKKPDIEPIDPDLVFDTDVQKQLHVSPNQVRQLVEARDKGTEATADQSKRVTEIDQQIKKLQEEMERLTQDRSKALQLVQKAQNEQVKAAIPKVLSRDAVQELRQLTLQRMQLSDILLNAKIRARLELNDEQVKKIQEISEKGGLTLLGYEVIQPQFLRYTTAQLSADTLRSVMVLDRSNDGSRAELLKVLTPQQREALERLSGMTFEKKK
jgi:RNA polymerase sigma factor (sigma-70 family)